MAPQAAASPFLRPLELAELGGALHLALTKAPVLQGSHRWPLSDRETEAQLGTVSHPAPSPGCVPCPRSDPRPHTPSLAACGFLGDVERRPGAQGVGV